MSTTDSVLPPSGASPSAKKVAVGGVIRPYKKASTKKAIAAADTTSTGATTTDPAEVEGGETDVLRMLREGTVWERLDSAKRVEKAIQQKRTLLFQKSLGEEPKRKRARKSTVSDKVKVPSAYNEHMKKQIKLLKENGDTRPHVEVFKQAAADWRQRNAKSTQ